MFVLNVYVCDFRFCRRRLRAPFFFLSVHEQCCVSFLIFPNTKKVRKMEFKQYASSSQILFDDREIRSRCIATCSYVMCCVTFLTLLLISDIEIAGGGDKISSLTPTCNCPKKGRTGTLDFLMHLVNTVALRI